MSLASLEKVLERWSKEVHDHYVKVLVRHAAVRSDVVEAGYAG